LLASIHDVATPDAAIPEGDVRAATDQELM
jgi:hypothetical protein